ncbi:MAG: Ni/Fe hydrogenase subunit alpha [archaeon]
MKTITLNHITKIEGHAKLNLSIDEGKVSVCELSAVEGSRYFEGLVIGRKYFEAHEITSRICGICSCAHVIAAITAIENALGFHASQQTKQLRELLMIGERIRSHATHLYFLALPDYLGYESALAMAGKYKKEIQRALAMMRMGNLIVKTIGGRDLHPISATVGGWLKLPDKEQLNMLAKELFALTADALATVKLFAGLKNPVFHSETEWFSISHAKEYALLEGMFISQKTKFEPVRYKEFIREYHEPRSTSNFIVKKDHRYMVGALARLNNNHQHLSANAKRALQLAKLKMPSDNPYHNNLAQAIEIVHCIDHAIRICKAGVQPEPVANIPLRAGTGIAAIEVPRGTLWHEYTVDEKGTIIKANIITPTAQNLLNMQEDIRSFLPSIINRSKEYIVLAVEKLIRSYDPCFSCSAHFLEVNWR